MICWTPLTTAFKRGYESGSKKIEDPILQLCEVAHMRRRFSGCRLASGLLTFVLFHPTGDDHSCHASGQVSIQPNLRARIPEFQDQVERPVYHAQCQELLHFFNTVISHTNESERSPIYSSLQTKERQMFLFRFYSDLPRLSRREIICVKKVRNCFDLSS